MKEEICFYLERWRQSRLKLSKNKSVESVRLGDLVMIRRTSRHDAPQFGLVTSIENQGRNGTVQLKTGYRLVTSVANLVPIGSGPVTTGLAGGEDRSAQLNNLDQIQSRLGSSFTHFVSLSIGDQEEQTKGIEKLQNMLENVEGIGKRKNLKKLHVTLMTLNASQEEMEMMETAFRRAGDRFTEITG